MRNGALKTLESGEPQNYTPRPTQGTWRGGRVAECAGLENRYTRKGIESSNLSLSATTRFPSRIVMLTSAEDDTCPEPGLVFLAFFSLF